LPDQGDFRSPKRKRVFRNYRIKHYREKLQNSLFGTQVQRLVGQTLKAQPGGRLLDVRCGAGQRLVHASDHYQCVGLDPSARHAGPARQLGFDVIVDRFDTASIESAWFDVVLMDSTLHHEADPVDVLKKANRILKPGGVVAVKVPKLWGFSNWLHDREWNGYRMGYHLTMFCCQSMESVMEAAGFQALRHPRRDRKLDDILIVWGRKSRETRERGSASQTNAA
jgi:SAM-dependent methyltransferase